MQAVSDFGRRAGPSVSAPPVEVARVDRRGIIVSVNREWNRFCVANGGDLDRCGPGISYLQVCEAADDDSSRTVAEAILSSLRGELLAPRSLPLTCDSPGEARWYELAVYPRADDSGAVLGATVALWRSPGPASAPVPDDGVLPLLKEASRAIDALWRSSTMEAPTSAMQLGEASQGVHRALIALAGVAGDREDDGPGPRAEQVVVTSALIDEAVQRLSRAGLHLRQASRRRSAGPLAPYLEAAVTELDDVLQELRRLAVRRTG